MLTEERTLLKELIENGVVNLYQIYQATRFSPGQIARVVRHYEDNHIIKQDDLTIRPTLFGKLVLRRIDLTIKDDRDKYWKQVPKEYRTEQIEINQPFEPNSMSTNKASRIISKSEMQSSH